MVQEGAIMCGARGSNYVWCKKEQLCVVQESAIMKTQEQSEIDNRTTGEKVAIMKLK